MSFRDPRGFVTGPGSGGKEKLVRRVGDGLASGMYKPVDYDQLRLMAAEKKFAAQKSLAKVKKLEQVSKQQKDQNLLKQHRRVWDQELSRLNAHRRRYQAELDTCLRQNFDADIMKHFFHDFESYDMLLDKDLAQFKKNTVDPVWSLRDDLLYWMAQNQADLRNPSANLEAAHQHVLGTVESVKEQQRKILEQLKNEQIALENDLKAGSLPEMAAPSSEKQMQTGIPQEAFDLECPDLELKSSVLQEFIFLDTKYVEKLDEMEERHLPALGSDTGGWTEDEHNLFLAIIEQYTHDIKDRRKLYIDRLMRHLPQYTRTQIVVHEDWWLMYKYYHERRKSLINDWLRDRRELYNRARVVFQEVVQAHELAEAKAEHQEKQRELCQALFEKVQEWREQKMEAMRLEAEIEEAKLEEIRAIQEKENEREKKKREKEKEKISAFHQEMAERNAAEEEARRKKLEKLKKALAEQALYDQERIRYREEKFQEKVEASRLLEEQKHIDEEEKEKRLEALREKVRPNVEPDLLRLWADTESWAQRFKKHPDDVNLQQPLFNISTFNSNQVTSDPRVKLENRLREAGVLNSDYARKILQQVAPPQPPRRDMESTVFKN